MSSPWQRPADRPLVIGHRGQREGANTAAAMRTALGAGADAVECDLRLATDGTLFCCHDAHLKGRPAELLTDGERRTMGIDRFDAIRDCLADFPDRGLVVEIKTQAAARAFFSEERSQQEMVISYSDRIVLQALRSGFPVGYVSAAWPDVSIDLAPLSAKLCPSIDMAYGFSERDLARANVWTVNNLYQAEDLATRGVWALTTDYPQLLLQLFGA